MQLRSPNVGFQLPLEIKQSRKNKEKAVNNNCSREFRRGKAAHSITRGLLAAFVALAVCGTVFAQDKKEEKDEITFNLLPNPAVIDCLRANPYEEPRARATVIRGKQNDTLILDLDGIKPGLAFDLFTVQNSFFQANGTKDPNFTGSFGLAWYQSDIKIGKQTDDGHVQIKTILLDDIFGFDPDVRLAPTNTFHLGFWFDNPQDAAAFPTCHFDPAKPTPFNGEHKAGPFAMLSAPDVRTTLGPLCTSANNSTNPVSCNAN
jgi:hypothetical protein